jgi:heme-degrading monooxygenase HmoA
MSLANTPEAPYYAVIFSSIRENDDESYNQMVVKMDELAKEQPGFLGFETVRDLVGISVSYWKDISSVQQLKGNVDHIEAQIKGKNDWYKSYKVRIAKVEREYSFEK